MLKKLNIVLPRVPPVLFLGRYIIENRDSGMCTPKFTAALLAIAKRYKQLTCPSTDEWINKMWSIHMMEYYSAMKRNEVLIHATT